MTSIEKFSPQRSGIEYEDNLEEKIVNSDVIFPEDVRKYADYVVDSINELKNPDQKESFVVDALSDTKILATVKKDIFAGDLEIIEAEEVIRRVRQALIEALKGKVEEKIYLVIKDFSKKNSARNSIIQQVVDVNSGQDQMYKEQEAITDHGVGKKAAITFFMEEIAKDGTHPNIVKILKYNPDTGGAIYEKLNFQSLFEHLKMGEKNKEDFLISLKVLKDCLAGAVYLEEKGLVLQDITLSNLGLVKERHEVKGIFFDVEGLMKEGEKLNYRLGPINDREYLPPELGYGKANAIKSSEMTYQLGVCLERILDFCAHYSSFEDLDDIIKDKLETLYEAMKEKKLQNRISLADAKIELEAIINILESKDPESELKVAS